MDFAAKMPMFVEDGMESFPTKKNSYIYIVWKNGGLLTKNLLLQIPKNNTKQMIQRSIHCIVCYLCVTTEVVTTDDVCITFLPDTSTASHTFPVISLNKG